MASEWINVGLAIALSVGCASAAPQESVDDEVHALLESMIDGGWDEPLERFDEIGEAAVPALIAALDDPELRPSALAAMFQLREVSAQALPELLDVARSGEGTSRWLAILTLGGIGEDGELALPYLVDALRDESPRVRWAAATALRYLGPSTATAQVALVRLLNDPDEGARLEAAYALATVGAGPRERIVEVLDAVAFGGDDLRRRTAFDALQWVEPPPVETVETILGALSDPDEEVRLHAASALVVVAPEKAGGVRGLLVAGLDHRDPYYRARSAQSLGNLNAGAGRVAYEKLKRLLEDPSEAVREAAAVAVERLETLPRLENFTWRELDLFAVFESRESLTAVFATPLDSVVYAVDGDRFLDGVVEQVGPVGVFVREEALDENYIFRTSPEYIALFESADIPLPASARDGDAVSVNVENGALTDLVQALAKLSGLNIVVHPGVANTVSIRAHQKRWDRLLEEVLAANQLAYAIEGVFIRICNENEPPPPPQHTVFDGELITVTFNDLELSELVDDLVADVSGLTLEGRGYRGKEITMYAVEVPWDQVLEHALRSHGLTYARDGDVLRVFPIEAAR